MPDVRPRQQGRAARPRGALCTPLFAIAGAAAVFALAAADASPAPGAPRLRAAADAPPGAPCRHETFEQSVFTVCGFDPAHDEFRLVARDAHGRALRSFAALERALGKARGRVRFAMNAGMFGSSGEPVGLLIVAGVTHRRAALGAGAGNFGLQPNGVFSVDGDGGAHIETTEAYLARAPHPAWATQSGPMLVIEGALHPALAANGTSLYVRNGVGATVAGGAVFAISDAPVSFGRFARFFRDRLGCVNALYLDGAISSLWAPSLRRRDDRYRLGPLALVLARAR